ncbi:MAG: ATP-binding protein, partial [Acidobacteriota bacterium]|nr:ATP-binding protein [Acidobacteriota bacterium]
MDTELLEGFIKQAEDYLPTIRGGILVCAQEGNLYGELQTSFREVESIKNAALIVGFDDVAQVCAELEKNLKPTVGKKEALTDEESRRLLDKLTELEVLLTKIHFSLEDSSETVADFVEESFDNLQINPLPEKIVETVETLEETEDAAEEFEIDDEMVEVFTLEAEDIVRSINASLEILEKTPDSREALLSVRLQRTVRVVCNEEGKSAELFIESENLEVDTQILDSFIEPLLHLLRNAVAHGIEPPETRRMLGKSESGKISLRLITEGTHIVLTVSDDGRGISVSALKDKAVSNGFISKEKVAAMNDAEAFELAFLPGLTTAEKLSQVSGRGVGLNIVKTGIARQQGTILIDSEPQKGTTFTIRLPMALAVTRAILVKANRQTFAFPLKLVKPITDISAKHLEKSKKSVQLGDVNYKVSHLNELLNLPVGSVSNNPNIPLLLLDTLENPCALIVDEIVKTEEIVIKPLGNPLRNLTELLGATILGDGSIVPVLDVVYLLKQKVSSSRFQPSSQEPEAQNLKPETRNLKPFVLIVDDSPSVRQLTSNIIKNVGWTAIIAKDGLEALEMLQETGKLPDIILTDVEMPRMNGYELLASLKRQENL